MIDKIKKITIAFVLLELVIGSTVGYFYMDNFEGGNKDLNQSIIEFYLTLNGLFLGTTLLLGVLNVLLLKKWDRLGTSVLTSIASGFLFLLIYISLFSFLSYALKIRLTPLFLTLIGFVIGFNFGLLKKVDPELKSGG